MNRYCHIVFVLAFSVIIFLPGCGPAVERENPEPVRDTILPLGFLTDTLSVREGKVARGETFGALLVNLGMSAEDAYGLVSLCADSIFDVKKFIAGNAYQAYYASDSSLKYLVYDNSRTMRTVFRCADSLGVWKAPRPLDYVLRTADVTIKSSLWNDMMEAGLSPNLILKLSDIYAWTVDFFALRQEDRFRAYYGETLCEGDVISVDTVYFAVFTRDGKDINSIMLDQGDGGNIYWSETGESLRKAFLKAPLNFTRISSGFSYNRKHPVTGQIKAHTAIDYAAPTGTPVMTIGDGTVISKGYAGGGGNTVRIRHNSVYETSYMHLSRYAAGLHVGQRVQQGEVIGYVGSTGTATGPHLDFRVYMNGTPINPLKMESPSAEPIKEEFLPALDSLYKVYTKRE